MSDAALNLRTMVHRGRLSRSAVSWGAIVAGAIAAAAFSFALFALGAGIGLASISPWGGSPSPTTFGVLAGAWLIAIELFALGLGGYLAGRLRTRWSGVHSDEAFFRDTAHGLLVWALASVIGVALFTSAISSGAAKVAQTGAAVAQTVGATAGSAMATGAGALSGYFTDLLFRTDHAGITDAASAAEAGRILAANATSDDLAAADKTYLGQLIATRTGLSQADAEKRASDVLAQIKSARDKATADAKSVADAARNTAVYVSLWGFVALLAGAVSASYMATVGGRVRDDVAFDSDDRIGIAP